MNGITNNFQVLRGLRGREEKRSVPQREVADAAGVSQKVISQWMNDNIEGTTLETMVKLCVYFNCQLSDLVQIDLEEARKSLEAQGEIPVRSEAS